MAVRSIQLAAHRTVGTTAETLYTCPAGRRTILKSAVYSWRTSIVPGTLRLILDPTGAVAATGIDYWAPTFQLEAVHRSMWVVLNAGDVLTVTASHASAAFVVLSGAELVLT